jgi:PAS domain S-box-containing protein
MRIALGGVALCLVLAAHAWADHNEVRVAVFEMRPLAYDAGDGQWAGFNVEILQRIARAEGWNLTFVPGSFPETLRMLESHSVDMHCLIAYDDERALKYDYTEETVFADWGEVYARGGIEVESVMDLEGRRVAMLGNSIFRTSFGDLLESFHVHAEIVFVDDYLDTFRLVERGEADAMVVNRVFALGQRGRFNVHKTPIIFHPIDIRFAVPTGTRAGLLAVLDRNLKAMKADEGSFYYQAMDRAFGGTGKVFGVPAWAKWALGAGAGAALLLGGMSIVLRAKVRARTADLSASEGRYRTLVDHSLAGVFRSIVGGRFLFVNDAMAQILEYPDTASLMEGGATALYADPGERRRMLGMIMKNGTLDRHELEVITARGNRKTILMSASIEGETISGIFVDITERKRAERAMEASIREKEVLLQEVHHRVKNNMAVISSLHALQERTLTDEGTRQIFRESRNRIHSLALVHEMLYRSDTFAEVDVAQYVRRLVDALQQSLAGMGSRVRFEYRVDAPAHLDIDHLIPCGLIITEAVTNALKYAFPGGRTGSILVELAADGPGRRLVVADDGVGLPEGLDVTMTSATLGFQIIAALAFQLDGKMDVSRTGGTRIEIGFEV